MERDKSRDGFINRLELFALTNFKGFWRWFQRIPLLARWINRFLVNNTLYKVETRPYPFSLMTLDEHIPDTDRPKKIDTYTSWKSLRDQTYTGRHLPPKREFNQSENLPVAEDVATLFQQRDGQSIYSEKSTLLFPGLFLKMRLRVSRPYLQHRSA